MSSDIVGFYNFHSTKPCAAHFGVSPRRTLNAGPTQWQSAEGKRCLMGNTCQEFSGKTDSVNAS